MRWSSLKNHSRLILGTLLLVLAASLHVTGIWPLATLQKIDYVLYDLRLRWDMPKTLDDRIVIIDVDEHSLMEIGQWPWGRDVIARLVRKLTEQHQVAALGLDTVFAEPDRNSSLHQLQRLSRGDLRHNADFNAWLAHHAPMLDHDQALARTLEQGPVALAFYLSSDRNAHQSGQLPRPSAAVYPVPSGMLHWSGYGAAIAPLADAARAAGFINSRPDNDGLVRAAPVLAAFNNGIYESLALATLRQAHSQAALQIMRDSHTPDASLRGVRLVGTNIPPVSLGMDGAVLVPYRGAGGPSGGSFHYIPAAHILQDKVPIGSLKGKLAFLGFTAPGLMDLRATPVGPTYPGVEVHASILSGMLDGRVPYEPDWTPGFQLVLVLALGALFVFLMPTLRAGQVILLGLLLLAGLVALNMAAFVWGNLALPLATPLVLTLSALGLNLALGYLAESRVRRGLAQQFATYVPPELVQQMQRDPDRYDMQARAENLTIMFCDLRGFTGMSEDMEPLTLQALLNQVLSELSSVIRRYRGTIDKYIGDCVMAFWGAPVAEPQHASQALSAALAMLDSLRQLNAGRVERCLPEVRAGVGLNTGVVSVGNMGSDVRRAYTVIGDAVNLAARLEALTRTYDVDLLVSEYTHAQVPLPPEGYAWQRLDHVRVKGRLQSLDIYTLRTPAPGQDLGQLQAEITLWNEVFDAWRRGDLPLAKEKIIRLRRENPDLYLYHLYENRITANLLSPPVAAWDGVTVYTDK